MTSTNPPIASCLRNCNPSALAERVDRLAIAVDSAEVATTLPPSVEILWEVNSGQHRLGTPPGAATVKAVRALLERIPPDRFRGLITYGGTGTRQKTMTSSLPPRHRRPTRFSRRQRCFERKGSM